MGIFGNLFGKLSQRFNALENPAIPITASGIISASGGGAGGSVFVGLNEQQALSVSTVWACVKTIAETLSTSTPQVYSESENGKRKAKESALYEMLTLQPNAFMGWDTLIELVSYQLLLQGNSFLHVERNLSGAPIAIVPLPPSCVKIFISGNEKSYVYQPTSTGNSNQSGQPQSYHIPSSDMLHFLGLSRDGIVGLSPVTYAATSIGLASITGEYQARWYWQGVRPSMVLSSMSNLKQENRLQLRESMKAMNGGMAGVGRPLVLPHGIEIAKSTLDQQDQEILKTREFSIQDICQWFRLRPMDIGIEAKVSGAAATLTTIQFLQSAILPWSSKIEREIGRKLLNGLGLTFQFDFDHLLRADIATQTDLVLKLHSGGLLTGNESRVKLGLQAMDDPYLNGFVVPQATISASSLFSQSPESPAAAKPVEVLSAAEEPRQLPPPKAADLPVEKEKPIEPRASNAAVSEQEPNRTAQKWLIAELERVHRRHIQKITTSIRRGEPIETSLRNDLQATIEQITPAATAFNKDPAKMGREFVENEIAHFGKCANQDEIDLQDSVFLIF